LHWIETRADQASKVELVHDLSNANGGDFLFLVSCSQILRHQIRRLYRVCLVLHASDLPKGRGWSPYIWAIVDGASSITISLIEAAAAVDTGDVWLKSDFVLEGHELLPEIHDRLFREEIALIERAIADASGILPRPQVGATGDYLRKRTPEDSRLDPLRTIAEQFDQMRVADPERYPSFFEFRGHRYRLRLEKLPQEQAKSSEESL
jgi:methionyl-tRNA formyltransferase